jgi:protein-S-isoprenylcysteine O-methyltransferase Ste14
LGDDPSDEEGRPHGRSCRCRRLSSGAGRRIRGPGLRLAGNRAAIAVAGAGIRKLHEANTSLDVRKPTTALVTTGIYARTRNPLYFGLMLMYRGVGALRGSGWHWLLAAPTAAALESAVIEREEAYLARKFGGEYRIRAVRSRSSSIAQT